MEFKTSQTQRNINWSNRIKKLTLYQFLFCWSTNRVEPGKNPVEHNILWIFKMRSFPQIEKLFRFGKWLPHESVCNVMFIQRHFERGNHNADGLHYIAFRLDWVINVLVKYSGTEGIDSRVIDLLREVKDTITSSQCASSHAWRRVTRTEIRVLKSL